MEFETTKIGERGQVVIPQTLRNQMSIHKGDKFMILQKGDVLVLKKLRAPSKGEFESMLKKAHEHAKKHKLTEEDVWVAVKKARSKN